MITDSTRETETERESVCERERESEREGYHRDKRKTEKGMITYTLMKK